VIKRFESVSLALVIEHYVERWLNPVLFIEYRSHLPSSVDMRLFPLYVPDPNRWLVYLLDFLCLSVDKSRPVYSPSYLTRFIAIRRRFSQLFTLGIRCFFSGCKRGPVLGTISKLLKVVLCLKKLEFVVYFSYRGTWLMLILVPRLSYNNGSSWRSGIL
jgi:hypothetical protein